MAPAFDAVFFDWCGTIVGYPSIEERLRPVLEQLGRPTTDDEVDEIAASIRAADEHPDAIDADTRCDLSAAGHAEAKRVVCEIAGIDGELGLAFERSFADLATYPLHPEAIDVLRRLADNDVEMVIVSDFHVDLRPFFDDLGVLDLLAGFALSYEVGAVKPDPVMFEHALALVDAPPERCMMVGDNPRPDCGAAALGIATLILPVPRQSDRPPLLRHVESLVVPHA